MDRYFMHPLAAVAAKCRIAVVVILFAAWTNLLAIPAAVCVAQEARSLGLPAQHYGQLQELLSTEDPAAFAGDAAVFWKLRKDWTPEQTTAVRNALAARAQELVGSDQSLSEMDSSAVQAVLQFASSTMNAAEKQRLKQRVEAAFPVSEDSTFDQLLSRISLSTGLSADALQQRQSTRQLVADWLLKQDLGALSQSQLNASFRLLSPAMKGHDGFRVVWTGFLTPARTGPHVFSIPPGDINTQHIEDGELYHNQLAVSAQVNGHVALDAKADAWTTEGPAVELVAGEKVPFRVELVYSYSTNDHPRMCPAILSWQAPGLRKSVVPASAFSQENGSAGLQAEYNWTEEGSATKRQAQTIDPNIDFVWVDALSLDIRDEASRKLAEALVARWTKADGEFLEDIARRPQIIALLTSDQLRACLESATQDAKSLRDVSRSRMERFIYATRGGGGDAAVDVLGRWSTVHDYFMPQFAASVEDYFDFNHEFNHRIAQFISAENPKAMELLERVYLENEDGSCNLNVAATLSECHLMLGTIPDWIESLDARLADESLAGDQRVDWLIARSLAEEFKYASANRYYRTQEELLAGEDWLDEAALVAESPQQQLKIVRERLTRLVLLGSWEAVDKELAVAQKYAQSAATKISTWQPEIKAIRDRMSQQRKDYAALANQEYVQELQRRRVLVSNQEDLEALRVYDRILTEAKQADAAQ